MLNLAVCVWSIDYILMYIHNILLNLKVEEKRNYGLLLTIWMVPFIVNGWYAQWYVNVPAIVGLKDNWPEAFGFMSLLDGNTSAPVSMINSCFVSVGFWIFMMFLTFAKAFNVGLGVPLVVPIQL